MDDINIDIGNGKVCKVCGSIWFGHQCQQCKEDRDWERKQARKGRPIKIRYGCPSNTIPGLDDETEVLGQIRARRRARKQAREFDEGDG